MVMVAAAVGATGLESSARDKDNLIKPVCKSLN
ncbi:mCG48749 [Mus musculus]|nr:mCG48749 [Mus musculus]